MTRERLPAVAVILAVLLAGLCAAASEPLPIGDNERIVLVGDAMHWLRPADHPFHDPELLAAYFFSRFPARRISFVKVAPDLATTASILAEADLRVLRWKPTLVIVDRGVYDVDSQFRRKTPDYGVYRPAMEELVAKLKAAGARVVLCSPTPIGNGSSPDNLIPPNDGLARLAGEAREIAAARNARFIDVFAPLVRGDAAARGAKPPRPFFGNRVYLFPEAHAVLSDAVLEGLGASGEISAATVDGRTLTAQSRGCRVSDITRRGGAILFGRQDACVPMPMPNAAIASLGAKYNRVMLRMAGLAVGDYELSIDGRQWGRLTDEELRDGVNLASRPSALYSPPYDEYLRKVRALDDMAARIADIACYKLPGWVKQADFERQREAAIARQVEELEEAQSQLHCLFQPKPHQFEVRPVDKKKGQAQHETIGRGGD